MKFHAPLLFFALPAFFVTSHLRAEEPGYKEISDPQPALKDHSTYSIQSWTLHLNKALRKNELEAVDRMLELMVVQLNRVIEVVPKPALQDLQKVVIWVNPTYEGVRPTAEYHGNPTWLANNGRDPAMGKSIEITNTLKFPFENRRMPYLLLHELSHAYHDQVLGFDQPDIIAAFEHARDSGTYDHVKRFNGNKIVMDKAYAMSNHKEYFAELTEAYFGKNDFYPFDRAELKTHDPMGFDAIEKAWKIEPVK